MVARVVDKKCFIKVVAGITYKDDVKNRILQSTEGEPGWATPHDSNIGFRLGWKCSIGMFGWHFSPAQGYTDAQLNIGSQCV